jgi:hypothetical protein
MIKCTKTKKNTQIVSRNIKFVYAEEWRLQVIKWIQNNGRLPSKRSNNMIEKRLGIWCNTQRQNKRENILNENRIIKLEMIQNWYWEKKIHLMIIITKFLNG